MPFCTKCGHKNLDDSGFCEECGHPLKKGETNQAATSPSPSVPQSLPSNGLKKIVIGGAVGLVALIAIAAGAYLLLSPETASEAVFAKAIESAMAANPHAYADRVCLDNFDYSKDPVDVNPYDGNTQKWLKILVNGGLYTPPETITEGSGVFTTTRISYRKTEAGNKATKGTRLCFADGLALAKVTGFTPPQKLGDTFASRATAKFTYRNPMPWIQTAEAKAMVPNRFAQDITDTFALVLKNGKWEVAPQVTLTQLAATGKAQPQQHQTSTGGGFFDNILGFFSGFGGNPILGKWKGPDDHEFSDVNIEFRPDTMRFTSRLLSNEGKVRYEVRKGEVLVYPIDKSVGHSVVVKVIDKDTIFMDDLAFKRVGSKETPQQQDASSTSGGFFDKLLGSVSGSGGDQAIDSSGVGSKEWCKKIMNKPTNALTPNETMNMSRCDLSKSSEADSEIGLEVGSKEWCKKIMNKPTAALTTNEAMNMGSCL